MRRRRISGTIVGIVAAALFTTAAISASVAGSAESPRTKLTIIAPAAPGGGWDGFARESQRVMRANTIAGGIQVLNIPGAAGTIGLSALSEMGDRHDVIMVTGGVMVGGVIINNSQVSLTDVTPIARLADDYNVLVVPASSPYETLDEFMLAFAENPGGTAIAGGSLGGIDHILAGLLAQAAGVDPADVNYLVYSGGGEIVASLLSGTAVAGLSGYNEFRDQIEAGNLRALAVSSPEPLPGTDVPTFASLGYDVTMSNWRGFVAPPGISDAVRDELVAMVTEMRATEEWEEALSRNNWVDGFMVGDELEEFIRTESERTAIILEELGL